MGGKGVHQGGQGIYRPFQRNENCVEVFSIREEPKSEGLCDFAARGVLATLHGNRRSEMFKRLPGKKGIKRLVNRLKINKDVL